MINKNTDVNTIRTYDTSYGKNYTPPYTPIEMPDTFLAIDKEYLGKGLTSNELLVLAQIEEFNRNKRKCFVTDKQFMGIIGHGQTALTTAIKGLEKKQIIERHRRTINGNGCISKQRVISLKENYRQVIMKNQTEASEPVVSKEQASSTKQAIVKNGSRYY